MMQSWSILPGDCRASLATLDAGSVQTCPKHLAEIVLRAAGETP